MLVNIPADNPDTRNNQDDWHQKIYPWRLSPHPMPAQMIKISYFWQERKYPEFCLLPDSPEQACLHQSRTSHEFHPGVKKRFYVQSLQIALQSLLPAQLLHDVFVRMQNSWHNRRNLVTLQ